MIRTFQPWWTAAVAARVTLACMAALAVLAAAFWHWDVLSVTSPLPVFAGFDLYSEFFPRHHYAGAALRDGRIPLWDPTQAAGLPFVATWQAGFFYPPNLLHAVLPTGLAMGVLARFHLFLCGAFTWLLAREVRLSVAAALLAAITFMLCGATVFTIYHTCAIDAAPWLPAALLFAWRLGERPRMATAVALAAVLALQFLAGRDYIVVMTLDAVALLTLFQVATRVRSGEGFSSNFRHLGLLAVAALLTAGLVAVQALPTLELAARSSRTMAGLPPQMLEPFGPMTPRLFLADLVSPFRGPIRREYLGWIPLVFGVIGLLECRRRVAAAYFAALATISLLLVFGLQTPAYALYAKLPLGTVFRLPDRFVFLFSMGVSLLAGLGLDRVFRRSDAPASQARSPLPAIAMAGTFCLLVMAAVATKWLRDGVREAAVPWGWFLFYGFDLPMFGGLGPAALYAVAALLLVIAAVIVARGPQAHRMKLLIVALAAIDLLYAFRSVTSHPESGDRQVMSAAGCYEKIEPLLQDHGRHLSLRLPDSYAIKDKDGELFGTSSATHYDPLVTSRHATFFGLLQQGGTPVIESPWNHTAAFMGMLHYGPRPERLKLLDLLGVRAVLVDGRPAQRPAAYQSIVSRYELRDHCTVESGAGEAPVDVLANSHAMPRASVLFDAVAAAGMDEAAEVLGRDDFDPASSVVVEAEPSALPAVSAADAGASASIVEYAENRVVVDVKSAASGILLLTDSWDPDWTASVNGRDARIHPADVLFRAVVVDKGSSRVVFEYHPKGFRIGSVVTASSVLLALVLVAFARRSNDVPPRRRQRDDAADATTPRGVPR